MHQHTWKRLAAVLLSGAAVLSAAPVWAAGPSVEALQEAKERSRDGEQGYRTAAQHVKNPQLRNLFEQHAASRGEFIHELDAALQRLPEAKADEAAATREDGSVAAVAHRGWIALKDVVTQDDKAIVTEVIRGEEAALATYDDALKNQEMDAAARRVLERQRGEIARQLDAVKAKQPAQSG